MARIKHYNRKTNKWEYADSSFTVGGNIDYYEQPEAPDDAPVGSLWYDTDEMPPEESGGISITGATVGQTVKISAVDENGVPTAWEPVDLPSEEEYELIETITIEQSVALLNVGKYPDGEVYNLKKAIVIATFPLMNEQYTTGSIEVNFTVNGKRAYGAYGGSMNIPVHDTRFFQLSAEAVINGGLIMGRNNMSMTNQLEHAARNNGPIISKVGENKIMNVSVYVANGIPAGTTIEIYGVRA